ncbi:hypothetical protein ABW21_db0200443 [Orbilia brochopaga]|nr:hypothetical protein ABW21_db0200443 [Drechslerella brochopaga]
MRKFFIAVRGVPDPLLIVSLLPHSKSMTRWEFWDIDDILCVSTDWDFISLAPNSKGLKVIVATPIFIVANVPATPTPPVNVTPISDYNHESHATGLKIGIIIAVVVPSIAVLAFLYRVYIINSRKRLEDNERQAGPRAIELSASRRSPPPRPARDRCNDDDSISDPPPPYLTDKSETPPPGIDACGASRTGDTSSPAADTANVVPRPGDIHHDEQEGRTSSIHPPAPAAPHN